MRKSGGSIGTRIVPSELNIFHITLARFLAGAPHLGNSLVLIYRRSSSRKNLLTGSLKLGPFNSASLFDGNLDSFIGSVVAEDL